MKIKEVRKRLESLRQLYDNAIKIQNCCMNNNAADGAVTDLEEKSGINTSLRNFATCVGKLAADEIKRISDVIDNTDAKID